ncbi:hypothetical protein AF332_18285 [Sporosarcina globispora]|uniref:Uncharacterized protein n=1 Tax=Sporosarcina globispora TaxID=1459 RepID=A0A0M0GGK2_SPOGL|nr:glycerol-3-phosphate dehydrogenase/oxidase [Sporosarcina globispora]KON88561.1 hypothetical protein AF332_18285 [Sporosarcina globispora]
MVKFTGLKIYDIKEIKITYKMALPNPKYEGNVHEIIKILANEYNVSFEAIYKILYGENLKKSAL